MIHTTLQRTLSVFALLGAHSIAHADSVPADLEIKRFSGPDITPSPACLCVSALGEVYAGVDLNGSLGKGPGKGSIMKLIDKDQDGETDTHTVFAEIDNPRGLIAVGSKLYILHTAFGKGGKATGMDLAVLDDGDGDGVADGPPKVLVKGICSAKAINDRGTDHSTNGIRMGIDGWIYIAVGDFGFADATGTDGTKLTLLGGGIARVRPDGTELEMYTTGTRNIYDVAIDPFMNCFTRGNTNDGGGWNVRFLDHIQSGEYGYPRLFKNFTSEIIPALEDLGGGSGVGSFFLSEPTWPEHYNNQPLMGDWGRKAIFLHRLTPDGPSFTQKPEEFAQVSQVTDLDVDPSGQMFVSAWDGAGYKGDAKKGYIARITPKDWKPLDFPKLGKLETPALVKGLTSPSATTRFHVQQEILARPAEIAAVKPALVTLIQDAALPQESRVAALYTLAQIETDPKVLLTFAGDDALGEFALRAATDRLPRLKNADLPLETFVSVLKSGTARQRVAAAIALGRLGDAKAAPALLEVPFTRPSDGEGGAASEKVTIKPRGSGEVKLAVTPGQELRFHMTSTKNPKEAAPVSLLAATFKVTGGNDVSLEDLKPSSGIAKVTESENSKGNRKGKSTGGTVVVSGPGIVTYTVPPGAVSFTARLAKAGDKNLSVDFMASAGLPGGKVAEGSGRNHATPNSEIILPHVAAHALTRLRATGACLAAIGTPSEDLALWALSSLHEDAAVDGLLDSLESATAPAQRAKLLTTLARLYQQEAPFDGSWWWTTRPDTRGPYYKPVKWSASPRIAAALEAEAADPGQRDFLAGLNDSHRLGLEKLGTLQTAEAEESLPTVDLAKIASQKGAVATTPIEDVILAMDELKPNPALGEKLYTQQGCMACHALEPGGPALGPFMGQIGSIMNPGQIATAILRPSDSISQGFQTVMLTMKDGSVRTGFATETTADKIVLRDLAGAVSTVATADVEKEEHLPNSMMPEGLANALSLDELAALVHYLASKK